jgi:hypothetical protein
MIKTCMLSLAAALLVGVAGAQTWSEPAVGRQPQLSPLHVGSVEGRRLQPARQPVGSNEANTAGKQDRAAQSEIDHLYNEIMRAAARGR